MTKEYITSFRAYHDDVDFTGVMYNANYLKYMERARSDMLREAGFDQKQILEGGISFVLSHADVAYKKPVYFNDECIIATSVLKFGKASVLLQQDVRLQSSNDVMCRGNMKIVCISKEMKPVAIPEKLFMEIKKW